MTQFLPPNLLALFAPRDPLPFLPPPTKLAHEKRNRGFGSIAEYKHLFEDPKDTPAPKKTETKQERLERKKREKIELATYKVEQGIALYNPELNTNATSNPFKTLFVGRLNYDTTESKLRREFEKYGPIKTIRIINDRVSSKPRGYAFIEFKHERDMRLAYKQADSKKIEGRRVLVDVERGRTVTGWLPRRLGGGLGGRKDDK